MLSVHHLHTAKSQNALLTSRSLFVMPVWAWGCTTKPQTASVGDFRFMTASHTDSDHLKIPTCKSTISLSSICS